MDLNIGGAYNNLVTNAGAIVGVVSIPNLIADGISLLLTVGGVFVFICIIWSGWQWLMAGDNEQIVQQARDRLNHCLVGFSVLAVSYAIALAVQSFFGLNLFADLPATPTPVPTPLPTVAPTPTPNPSCIGPGDCGPCGDCNGSTCYPKADGASCTTGCWAAGVCTAGTCQRGGQYLCAGNDCDPDNPSTCGAGAICNPVTGQCQDPVVPNIATGQSCDDICADQSGTCSSVGTNVSADDGTAYLGNDASCPLTQNVTCSDVMNQYTPSHSACAGNERDWTNCLCEYNSLTCSIDQSSGAAGSPSAYAFSIIGQSFIPSVSGQLDFLEICYIFPSADVLNTEARLIEGQGPNGALISNSNLTEITTEVCFPWYQGSRWVKYSFDSNQQLAAGQQYSFEAVSPAQVLLSLASGPDIYPQGQLFLGGIFYGSDLYFRTDMCVGATPTPRWVPFVPPLTNRDISCSNLCSQIGDTCIDQGCEGTYTPNQQWAVKFTYNNGSSETVLPSCQQSISSSAQTGDCCCSGGN